MLEAHLLHNFREICWICSRRLSAIRVAVRVEIKVEADVDLPAYFGGGKKVLLFGGEIVVPLQVVGGIAR